jgi:hypothetical protein
VEKPFVTRTEPGQAVNDLYAQWKRAPEDAREPILRKLDPLLTQYAERVMWMQLHLMDSFLVREMVDALEKDLRSFEDKIEPQDVQHWLSGLTVIRRVKGSKTDVTVPMAPKTKGHLKQFMHRLFAKAMYWRFVPREINPISLVELRGVTRRRRKADDHHTEAIHGSPV